MKPCVLQFRSAPPAACVRLSTCEPTQLSHLTLGASSAQKSEGGDGSWITPWVS